jgi:hypothetical protein
MRLRVIATALVTLVFASSSAFAGGIGIFSSTTAGSCNLTMLDGAGGSLYVFYLPQGGPAANGAEYKIEGMPGVIFDDWLLTLQPATGSNVNLGTAFDGTGHNVAWPAPQAFDGNGNLRLARWIFSFEPHMVVPAGTVLQVTQRTPPNNLAFPCPLVTDAAFNLHCQAGGMARVNGGPSCTVAVEDKTWTGVRNLYR